MPMAKSQYTPRIVLPSDIGPYRIHERLGAGGMGEVYRAYDRRLERWVAIKVVRPDGGEDPDHRAASLERFRREARAAAGLSHPGVVQIHDVLEREEGDCIVMELVEGETLGQVIRRGRLPLGRVVSLGREIAEALAAAHAKGVIHRDLKAENVMITADGRAKILDFGLAKRLGPEVHDATLSGHGKILGTSHAMSPEQAQGLPVDHRSDLFSFGSLLYELATGQAPFRREALAQTLTWVCTRNPTPAYRVDPEIPQLLSELIDHLLEKNPEHRPESAGQVAEVLRHLERMLASPDGESRASADHSGRSSARPGDRPDSAAHTEPTLLALPRPAYGADSAGTAPRESPRPRPGPGPRRCRPPRSAGRGGSSPRSWSASSSPRGSSSSPTPMRRPSTWPCRPRPSPPTTMCRPAELLPSAARVALLQELLSLEGVTTLAPDQVDAVQGGSAVDLARALAADEVISAARLPRRLVPGHPGRIRGTRRRPALDPDLRGAERRPAPALADGRRPHPPRLRRPAPCGGRSDRLAVAGADYERVPPASAKHSARAWRGPTWASCSTASPPCAGARPASSPPTCSRPRSPRRPFQRGEPR